MTGVMLKEAGYQRYEISNYAKQGYQSRHNSSYWTGIPYYGCGLGASSLVKDHDTWRRFHETTDLQQYLRASFTEWHDPDAIDRNGKTVLQEMEILTKEARMEEFMFLGLRMTEGIASEEFYRCFGCLPEAIFGGPIRELQKDSLLVKTAEGYALTEKGLDLSNYCFSRFLL